MKTLKKLYLTHSPSRKEKKLSDIVVSELKKIGVKGFKVDEKYQIFKLIKNTPLICAHMDQVQYSTPTTKVELSDGIIFGDGNLGADDKNGVWVLLKILKRNKNLSFIFSTQEEVGCAIEDILDTNKDVLKTIKYGLVFDRRGESDVIGTLNNYCTDEFEKDLLELMEKHNYKSVRGSFSDCNKLNKYMSCINISCGYYNPHTTKEFTIVEELLKSLRFGLDILKNIDKRYDIPEPPTYTVYSGRRGDRRWANWQERTTADHNNFERNNSILIRADERDSIYQCTTCYECFEWIELVDNIRRCQSCWGPLIELQSMDDYQYSYDKRHKDNYRYEDEEEEFEVGDKVIILSKSSGVPLDNSCVPWRMWDEAYIESIENKAFFLSKTKNGNRETGIFRAEDLMKDDKDIDEREPLCCMCEKITMDITVDQHTYGYIYMCSLCNFAFITEKKCNTIKELQAQYEKFITPY